MTRAGVVLQWRTWLLKTHTILDDGVAVIDAGAQLQGMQA